MKRFAVYRDISPTYVLCDRRTESIVARSVNRADVVRAARRLNDVPLTGRVRAVGETDGVRS